MGLKVLIVDDSSVTRAMLIKTMKMIGLPLDEIHQAGNGREGLDLLETNTVDLAMIDINMPVMDGEEMIRTLRENPKWKSLPIIVISTEGSQTRIERFHQYGAEFVHKPFAPEAVRTTIEELTGQCHVNQSSNTEF
jgi:two-component system chemotaxis response regulator CheY